MVLRSVGGIHFAIIGCIEGNDGPCKNKYVLLVKNAETIGQLTKTCACLSNYLVFKLILSISLSLIRNYRGHNLVYICGIDRF